MVYSPALVSVFDHLLTGAVVEPAVGVVGGQGVEVSVAKQAGGLGFPAVGESPQPGQLRGGGPAGKEPEDAACLDSAELMVVADQEHPGAGGLGLVKRLSR